MIRQAAAIAIFATGAFAQDSDGPDRTPAPTANEVVAAPSPGVVVPKTRYVRLAPDVVLAVAPLSATPDAQGDILAAALAETLGPEAEDGGASAFFAKDVYRVEGSAAAPPDDRFVVDWVITSPLRSTLAAFHTITTTAASGWEGVDVAFAARVADQTSERIRLAPMIASALEDRRRSDGRASAVMGGRSGADQPF